MPGTRGLHRITTSSPELYLDFSLRIKARSKALQTFVVQVLR